MERPVFPIRIYRFGPFELATDVLELRKRGVRLKLQDQPFQILCALLEHHGALVSRDQLQQQLWPEGTLVDFEHGLNTAIKKIRDALSDDADTSRYIETIPRKGYRFIGPVNMEGEAPLQMAPSPRVRGKWRVFMPIFLAGLAVLATVTLVMPNASYSPYLRISATQQLTFGGDLITYSTAVSTLVSSIETDGRRVYYFKHNDGCLYAVPVGGGVETKHDTRFVQPVILHISPDGSTLLVKEVIGESGGNADRIWLLPTSGGPARPLGDAEAEFAAWSPDGKVIVLARQNAIYLTEDEGTSYRRLVETPGNVSWIRWSPDGRRLRFSVFDAKTLFSSIWEIQREGPARLLARPRGGPENTCCGIWTRDGRYFLYRQLRDQRSDYWITEENGWLFGARKPFLLSAGGLEMVAATASSLENKIFVVGNEVSRMTFKFDIGHRQLTPFLPDLSVTNPVFSPDSKWIVLCQAHTRKRVLWRVRNDGSEWLQLADSRIWVHHARYSPDGSRIALMGKWPDRPWKIYWMPAEGGALHELQAAVENQADPNWMPDGQTIVFGQPPRFYVEPDAPRAIYIHNLLTGSTHKVPGSEGWFSPRISPDGRSMLALSIDEHRLAVYNFVDSRWRILLENPRERYEGPSWAPDGESVFVNLLYGKANSVFRIRLRDGVAKELLSFRDKIASPERWAWGSAPDASLLISCIRPNSNIYSLGFE